MEQLARVRECLPDGTAKLLVRRLSACSGDCHKCSGCGAVEQKMFLRAKNPIGAAPGDLVRVEAPSGPVLKDAAVLYMVPVALFLAGYLAGVLLGISGAAAGILGFALGLFLVVCYDRRVARKRETVYTITGYAEKSDLPGKKEDE